MPPKRRRSQSKESSKPDTTVRRVQNVNVKTGKKRKVVINNASRALLRALAKFATRR